MAKEKIREMIKESIAKLDPERFSEQERKMQEEIMVKIFEEDIPAKDAIGLTKEAMEALYSYTYRLYTSGKYDSSSHMFGFLITLDPADSRFPFGLGASCHMQKEYKKAIDGYLLAAFLQPDLPLPYYHMCDCYMHLNDKWCAIFCLRAVVKLCEDQAKYKKLKERSALMLQKLEKEMADKEAEQKNELEAEPHATKAM